MSAPIVDPFPQFYRGGALRTTSSSKAHVMNVSRAEYAATIDGPTSGSSASASRSSDSHALDTNSNGKLQVPRHRQASAGLCRDRCAAHHRSGSSRLCEVPAAPPQDLSTVDVRLDYSLRRSCAWQCLTHPLAAPSSLSTTPRSSFLRRRDTAPVGTRRVRQRTCLAPRRISATMSAIGGTDPCAVCTRS